MSLSGLRRRAPLILLFLALFAAILPARLPGAHARTIAATVVCGSGSSFCINILPSTTVTPGTLLQVSGSAFPLSVTNVLVSLNGTSPSSSGTRFIDGSGNFSTVALQVPAGQIPGTYSVTVTNTANSQILVTTNIVVSGGVSAVPTLTFSPIPVASQSALTISGSGFTPFATLTLTQLACSGTCSQFTQVTSTGTFSIPISAVPLGPGNYTFTANDGQGHMATSLLSVVSANTPGTSITLTPNTVVPGGSIVVAGSGYTPGNTVTVSGPSGVITSLAVTVGASGAFSATVAPSTSAAAGVYTISAVDSSGHIASATFTLTTAGATLTASPTSVAAGSSVTLTGTGFSGVGPVNITGAGFSSTVGFPLQSVTQTASGTFSVPVIIAATTPAGSYLITATDGTKTGIVTLTVTGGSSAGVTLSATPSNATAGQPVSLIGSGFTPGGLVTITGAGASSTATASASGTIIASLTPVSTTAGTYVVSASDAAGHLGSTSITIGATGISIVPGVTSATAAQVISFNANGFTSGEQVTVSLASSSAPGTALPNTTQTYVANSTGGVSGSYTVPALASGAYVLLALGQTSRVEAFSTLTITGVTPTATGTPGVVPFPTPASTATPIPAPLPQVSTTASTTIFDEGYTGTAAGNGKVSFNEKLYLFNPGGSPSSVTTTYYVYASGATTATTVTARDTVAAGSTIVRSVNNDAGSDKFVSIVVQSTTGIVAETVISRVRADGTELDTDGSLGSSSLNKTWYLAEGYTGASLQEYITLFNPGTAPATAQVQYLPSDTTAPAPQTVSVPANGRVTINVRAAYNKLEPHGSKNLAISVTSDQPIAVDRSMYWGDGDGSAKYGYSLGPAIATAKTSQSFSFLPAENHSQAFVTVLNPSTTNSATATLNLQSLGGGIIRSLTAPIGPGRRYTFALPNYLNSSNGAVTATLTSSVPLVAEAGLYFGGSPNIGRNPGMVVQGTTGGNIGARADVNPGGAQLRLYNPGPSPIRIQVTLGTGGGPSIVYDQKLPGSLARTIAIPAGTEPRGILVLGSGTFEATLINGGDGFATAWGGNLN